MVTITQESEFEQLEDNLLVGPPPRMGSSKVTFRGENNVLFCEPGVSLQGSTLEFNGDNGLIMLGKSNRVYRLSVAVNNNCTFVIGRENYFNGQMHVMVSEECTVVIGNDCLFSFGIWIRTADPHLIYDAKTQKRINPSKDAIIGDHVWIGQDALILKGTRIGSGSVLGALSVAAGKTIPSNSTWAGNPVKRIREDVFWDSPCVHSYTAEQTAKSMHFDSEPYLFEVDDSTISSDDLRRVPASDNARNRMAHFKNLLYADDCKNRFAVATSESSVKTADATIHDAKTGGGKSLFGWRRNS